jgi:hypothetical protein
MLELTATESIRSIFLHHEARVTIREAAGMLGWSRREMDAAIANGEIEVVGTGSGTRIELRELAEIALQRWSLVTIEEALGRDAASILPAGCGRGNSRCGCLGIRSGRSRCWRRMGGSRSRRC